MLFFELEPEIETELEIAAKIKERLQLVCTIPSIYSIFGFLNLQEYL